MRILMLVISSDTIPVYAQHREVWRTWMHSHPNVDCWFLQYSPLVLGPTRTKDTLFFRGTERYGSILAKTLDGLAYFLPRAPYTHVVRTNLSSVWNLPVLLEHLATLPSTRLYAGVECTGAYVSGAGIVMSRDIAELLLAQRRIAMSIGRIDDVDIGVVMQMNAIPLTPLPRVNIHSLADYEVQRTTVPPGSFHYRVKVKDWEGDRMEEPEIMRRILREHIYAS